MGAIRLTAETNRPRLRGARLLVFSIAAYQYLLITSVFVDVRLGAANAQVTAATLLLLACAALQRDRIVALVGWQGVTVLALGLVFIPFKMLTGLLEPAGIPGMRIFFILPLIWCVYRAYVTDDDMRETIASIIIWNCVVVALFGLIHFFFFPTVFFTTTSTEAYRAGNISLIPGHSQEAAFVGNASGYGAILVAGLFAIYLTGRRSLVYSVAFLVMVLATYIAISRAASFFATALLVVYVAGGRTWRHPTRWLPIAAAALVGVYVLAQIPFFRFALQAVAGRSWANVVAATAPVISPFSDAPDTGRFAQYKVGLQIVFRDVSHVLLGGANDESLYIGDVNFSDNSFIFLALGFGVPLTMLWIVTILRRMVPVRFCLRPSYVLLLLFLYSTLITTPALVWDLWLLYAVGLLFIAPDVAWPPHPNWGVYVPSRAALVEARRDDAHGGVAKASAN